MYDWIIKRILDELKVELGDIYDDFIEEMRYDNIIISGTFILQAIYKENWNSDIDIFIKIPTKSQPPKGGRQISNRTWFTGNLECCGVTHFKYDKHEPDGSVNMVWDDYDDNLVRVNHHDVHQYITPMEAILYTHYVPFGYVIPDYLYDNGTPADAEYIYAVRNYYHRTSDKRKIQIIQLTCDPSNFINNTFDFPIIQNIFGRKKDGTFYVEIASISSIMNRKTMFYVNPNFEKSITRAHKYHHKYNISFTFPFNDEQNKILNDILTSHKILDYTRKNIDAHHLICDHNIHNHYESLKTDDKYEDGYDKYSDSDDAVENYTHNHNEYDIRNIYDIKDINKAKQKFVFTNVCHNITTCPCIKKLFNNTDDKCLMPICDKPQFNIQIFNDKLRNHKNTNECHDENNYNMYFQEKYVKNKPKILENVPISVDKLINNTSCIEDSFSFTHRRYNILYKFMKLKNRIHNYDIKGLELLDHDLINTSNSYNYYYREKKKILHALIMKLIHNGAFKSKYRKQLQSKKFYNKFKKKHMIK